MRSWNGEWTGPTTASTTASDWSDTGHACRRQLSGHQVRAMSLRTSGRPAGRSSASSGSRRASVLFRGFCTVVRRMAASFSAYRVPRSHGGRPFWGEFLIGHRSVSGGCHDSSVSGGGDSLGHEGGQERRGGGGGGGGG